MRIFFHCNIAFTCSCEPKYSLIMLWLWRICLSTVHCFSIALAWRPIRRSSSNHRLASNRRHPAGATTGIQTCTRSNSSNNNKCTCSSSSNNSGHRCRNPSNRHSVTFFLKASRAPLAVWGSLLVRTIGEYCNNLKQTQKFLNPNAIDGRTSHIVLNCGHVKKRKLLFFIDCFWHSRF